MDSKLVRPFVTTGTVFDRNSAMEECSEMIRSHPGLILISEQPVTWKGFLIIDANLGFAIDIKLTVPNYPQVTDAILLFGQSISLLHGTGFDEKILKLLENANTVSSLVLQLKRIVTNLMKEKLGDRRREIVDFQGDIVNELKDALQMDTPVKISSSTGLNSVKLSHENVEVIIQKDNATNSWKIISSDLPELPGIEPFGSNIPNLSAAMNKMQSHVEMLLDTWDLLNEIDNSCWVVDPPQPKPYHLYRRVNLTSSLSALITVKPMDVDQLPDIKLLGSDSEVAKYRNILTSNLLKWDPENSIADNLRILMAIDELPQRPEVEEIKERNAIVEDDECCICFSIELDDQLPAQYPVEICSNEKCKKHFHTVCLQQWLQAIAANQVSFDRIHGTCPNCSETISCSLITS